MKDLMIDQADNILKIVEELLNGEEKDQYKVDYNNIIAICGDRGTGKTSTLLKVKKRLEDYENIVILGNEKNRTVNSTKLNFLIDPSAFNSITNILQIIVSKMYTYYTERITLMSYDEQKKYDRLSELFENITSGINFSTSSFKDFVDATDGLIKCNEYIDLSKNLNNLVQEYCFLASDVKKSKLVIFIDDIDLSLRFSYKMLEELRQFLNLENVIILLAYKESMLNNAVYLEFYNQLGKLEPKQHNFNDSIEKMTLDYLHKLIPVNRLIRIQDKQSIFNSCKEELYKLLRININFDVTENNKNDIMKLNILKYLFGVIYTYQIREILQRFSLFEDKDEDGIILELSRLLNVDEDTDKLDFDYFIKNGFKDVENLSGRNLSIISMLKIIYEKEDITSINSDISNPIIFDDKMVKFHMPDYSDIIRFADICKKDLTIIEYIEAIRIYNKTKKFESIEKYVKNDEYSKILKYKNLKLSEEFMKNFNKLLKGKNYGVDVFYKLNKILEKQETLLETKYGSNINDAIKEADNTYSSYWDKNKGSEKLNDRKKKVIDLAADIDKVISKGK